jgi:hypothetical protein
MLIMRLACLLNYYWPSAADLFCEVNYRKTPGNAIELPLKTVGHEDYGRDP